MSLVPAFYNLFEDFMTDIGYAFPDYRGKVLKYKSALSTARSVNGRAFIREFVDSISPYEKYIMECDEEHFLNKDPTELGITGETAEMCNLVKGVWKDDSTTIETKAKIWKYIQDILRLGNTIVSR